MTYLYVINTSDDLALRSFVSFSFFTKWLAEAYNENDLSLSLKIQKKKLEKHPAKSKGL